MQLLRHAGGEVLVLRVVLGDVVEFPLVTVEDLGHFDQPHQPRRRGRCSRGNPAVVVDCAVAKHLEILRGSRGRSWALALSHV